MQGRGAPVHFRRSHQPDLPYSRRCSECGQGEAALRAGHRAGPSWGHVLLTDYFFFLQTMMTMQIAAKAQRKITKGKNKGPKTFETK